MTPDPYRQVLEAGLDEFPDLKVVRKDDSRLMRTLDVLLRIITFNRMDRFMTTFTTTIGTTIYTPTNWKERTPESRTITVRHELVHFRQGKRNFFFKFLYLFVWFPIGLAWFRAKYEKEAYEESMRAIRDLYGPEGLREADKERIVRHFTTAEYFWMWPFRGSVERWYDEAVERVLKEE